MGAARVLLGSYLLVKGSEFHNTGFADLVETMDFYANSLYNVGGEAERSCSRVAFHADVLPSPKRKGTHTLSLTKQEKGKKVVQTNPYFFVHKISFPCVPGKMQRTAVVLAGAIAVGSFASGDSTRLFQRKVYEASGSRTCSPTDHGASPSLSDNAAAIQSALRECQGGGTVVLEGGEFKSGPLTVSGVNVTFEVADGASLRMAFPPLASSQQKEAEGASVWPSSSGDYIDVLVFDQCYGCTLTGQGLLHGGGIADQW